MEIKEHIKSLNANYETISYKIMDRAVVIQIKSEQQGCACPDCGIISLATHSMYQREIKDLPVGGKETILLVETKKMFCKNNKCKTDIFIEKHPFVSPKGKKTERLIRKILDTAAKYSSLQATKILKSENITIGKSSICSMLKRNRG